jgi:hypothetical protein
MLEALCLEQGQRRLMDAALAGEVAAAQRDQLLVFILGAAQIVAQTLEHKMLEVEHRIAAVAHRCFQELQGVGMPIEKIGMFAQIGNDIGGAGRSRLAGRRFAAAQRAGFGSS